MLKNKQAQIYIPDNTPLQEAMGRTTHLGIGAHPDDVEMLAVHGILECFGRSDRWFGAVIVTDGGGSARNGGYANYTDDEMKHIRCLEQKKAAVVGEYSFAAQLFYPSSQTKSPAFTDTAQDLEQLIRLSSPEYIYTHNPADKHDTHVAVVLRTIQALRALPSSLHPKKLYGCEVWRDLDWMEDSDKVFLDISERPNITAALLAVHDSQISGGKRYDLASSGRKAAHATFSNSHKTDSTSALTFAMDLTPLLKDPTLDIASYVEEYILRFRQDVLRKIREIL
jgi:LmbE family N-acetylglucosaminyl deacetylase